MTRYFAQNTPRAGLEHMMMSVPGFQKRGGGMMILSRFCYKPEDGLPVLPALPPPILSSPHLSVYRGAVEVRRD